MLVALGCWLLLAGSLDALLSGARIIHICPDRLLIQRLFDLRELPPLISVFHGGCILAFATYFRAHLRTALSNIIVIVLGVNLFGLEVGYIRQLRQIRAQWAWSDDQKRAAWLAYQGFLPADFDRVRALVPSDESIVFFVDGPGSLALARFLGYYCLPRKSYLGTQPNQPAMNWKAPPPGDWNIMLKRSRVETVTSRTSE